MEQREYEPVRMNTPFKLAFICCKKSRLVADDSFFKSSWYLPYTTQHALLNRLQPELETICQTIRPRPFPRRDASMKGVFE